MPKNLTPNTIANIWASLEVPIAGDPRNAGQIEAFVQRLLDNDSLLATSKATKTDLDAHVGNTNNPHTVTAAQLGAQAILDQVKTVDGNGSGLDADWLDGRNAIYFLPSRPALATQYTASIADGSAWLPSAGIYIIQTQYAVWNIQIMNASRANWITTGLVDPRDVSGLFATNGMDARILNRDGAGNTRDIFYRQLFGE